MPDFEQLAGAIAEGYEIDWEGAKQKATTDERPVVRALGELAKLAEAHRELHRTDPRLEDHQEQPEPLTWGHLELIEQIGVGGYGKVFRARDPQLDRDVALKLLPAEGVAGTADGRHILEEGRLLARIRHPNVATVFGAAEAAGRIGIWMELVRGRDLRQIVQAQGPLGDREVILIAIDLCRALAAVHGAGIVHGDLKAQNVLREQSGRIVLVDFGVGRDFGPGSQAQEIAGTPAYMAPEVLRGEPLSPHSDLYGLGVLLFYLLSTRFPAGTMIEEVQRAHRKGERVFLRDLRPDLPGRLVEVVEKACAAQPEDRYRTMGELERALLGVVGADGSWRPTTTARVGLRRLLWLGAGVMVSVLALLPLPLLRRDVGHVEAVTTASPAALALYQRAGEFYPEEIHRAVSLLRSAVALDPYFATAYNRMALYLDARGEYEEALTASTKAFQHRTHVTPAERYSIEGTYHLYRLDYDNALESFYQAVDGGPEGRAHIDARRQLALLYANLGKPMSAVKLAQESIDHAPNNLLARGLLVILLAEAGRADEALVEAPGRFFRFRHLLRRVPRGLRALRMAHEDIKYFAWGEGLAHLVADRPEEAVNAFQRMLAHEDVYASHAYLLLAQAHTYLFGREGADAGSSAASSARQAIEYLEKGILHDVRSRNTAEAAHKRYLLGRLQLELGSVEEASQLAVVISQLPDFPVFLKHLRSAGLLFADLGDLREVDRLAARVTSICEAATSRLCRGTEALLRASSLRLRGLQGSAEEELERSASEWEDVIVWRALAALALERWGCEEAKLYLEEIVGRKGRILHRHSALSWTGADRDLSACQAAGY